MNLKCLVVDDEDLARQLVESHIKDIGFLELKGSCSSAIEAINKLNSEKIDLIFLDIDMPKLDGLSFLRTLKNPPLVVLTTAFREYALESYELNVVDYLCKPFSFERFLIAVNKATHRIQADQPNEKQIDKPTANIEESDIKTPYLFIKADKIIHKVNFDEILFIESVGDYVKVITNGTSHITYLYLKDVEKMLPKHLFPRVHRSFIVSVAKIDRIIGNTIKMGKFEIPIGKSYKAEFLDSL